MSFDLVAVTTIGSRNNPEGLFAARIDYHWFVLNSALLLISQLWM